MVDDPDIAGRSILPAQHTEAITTPQNQMPQEDHSTSEDLDKENAEISEPHGNIADHIDHMEEIEESQAVGLTE